MQAFSLHQNSFFRRRYTKATRNESLVQNALADLRAKYLELEETNKCVAATFKHQQRKIHKLSSSVTMRDSQCRQFEEEIECLKSIHINELKESSERHESEIQLMKITQEEMLSKYGELSEKLATVRKELDAARNEVFILKENVDSKQNEISNLLNNIEKTDLYQTLNASYEEAVTDLLETKTERDRYLKRMQALEFENERIMTIAFREGFEIPASSEEF